MFGFIIFSIAIFIFETSQSLCCGKYHQVPCFLSSPSVKFRSTKYWKQGWLDVESICAFIFTLELVFRFAAAPPWHLLPDRCTTALCTPDYEPFYMLTSLRRVYFKGHMSVNISMIWFILFVLVILTKLANQTERGRWTAPRLRGCDQPNRPQPNSAHFFLRTCLTWQQIRARISFLIRWYNIADVSAILPFYIQIVSSFAPSLAMDFDGLVEDLRLVIDFSLLTNL